jgi:hypothetical protein
MLHRAIGQKFPDVSVTILSKRRQISVGLGSVTLQNTIFFYALRVFDNGGLKTVLDPREKRVKTYFLRRILELKRIRFVGHVQRIRETNLYNFPIRGTRGR